MLNEMERLIRNLEDKEVKSLLLQFLFRMQTVEEGRGYTEQQFYLDIKNTYYDLLAFKKREAHAQQHTQFHTTHLVFGDSPAAGLILALKESAFHHQEQIFNFSDLFSIGPIWHLHDAQGMAKRYKWLRTHLNIDDEVLFHYEDRFKQTLANIEHIPDHHSVIIWAGDNAHEQTGLTYVLYLLKEKTNNIFIINPNEGYKTHFARADIDFTPLKMGELSSKQLQQIYKNEKLAQALTQFERKAFERQWEQLCETKKVLRIWENSEITSVSETFYDEYIINTVENFHKKNNDKEFIKSARIIGEVIGHLNQYVGDQFIEYRILRLIVDGIFDMEGVPKAMRYYSIKLR